MISSFIENNPILFAAIISIAFIVVSIMIIYIVRRAGGVKIGDFSIDFNKGESVKGEDGFNAEQKNKISTQIEERTRYVISRQVNLIRPYLQSLRPIFNRLVYSILDDAIIDSLGIEKEIREVKSKEQIKGTNSFYLIEEVKTYQNSPKTRSFTNLVESTVDSLLCDFEIEIMKMLISNNIGKTKEEIQEYVKSRGETLIGIIRNNLCDAYNQLSNKNLFDTKKYWIETGINYPEDWIVDKVFQLLKSCMKIRYVDFID